MKTYSYAKDDRLLGIAYTGAVNPTPNVGFTWDPYFPRLASRTDGVGTTQFAYVPVGSLGALQVQQEQGPFANSAITSAYDELGRLSSRTVQGAGAETFQYDAIGRLTNHGSDLAPSRSAISARPARSPAASSPARPWPRPGATSPTPATAGFPASTMSA